MSILSALSEKRHDNKNLAELAKLPQALIMQMGQRKELSQEEVAMIISKKAEMIESAARQKALSEVAGGQMPSVMEQKMAEIAQAENPAPQQMAQAPQLPEDVGIAQNPVPPMQMAGGGIIAFDDGGDVDVDVDPEDDYQDLIDQANQDEMNDEIFGIIAAMEGSKAGNTDVGIRAGENKNIKEDTRGRSGDMVDRLRAQIMSKESGGKRYDKNGNLLTSPKGALGEMQVMPATARDPGFGIKAARDNSPEELRRVGDEYAGVLLNRYRDPKLAMIAYNMGPGATDKWLAAGADISKLPKETQGYIRGVNLAKGGEVKHFLLGDLVIDDFGNPRGPDPRTPAAYDEYNRTSAELEDEIRKNKKAGMPKDKAYKDAVKALEDQKLRRAAATQPKVNTRPGIGSLRGATIPALAISGAGALYEGLSGPDQVNIPTAADVNPGNLTAEEIANAKRPALIYPRIRGKERYTSELPITRDQKARPLTANPVNEIKKDNFVDPNIERLKQMTNYGNPPEQKAPTQDATPKEKAEEEAFNLMQYIRDRQARADKAAEADKWQAGLAAGLGMLGGTSQYWQENIGKGGQMGVQQLAQLQKLRASQDIAGDKMLGTAYNAEMLNKLRKQQLGDSNRLREQGLNQTLQKNREDWIARELKDRYGLDTAMVGPLRLKQRLGKISPEELEKLKIYDQSMRELERKADIKFSSQGSTAGWSAKPK